MTPHHPPPPILIIIDINHCSNHLTCTKVVNGDHKIGNGLTGNFIFPVYVHVTRIVNRKSGRKRGGWRGHKEN